MSTSSIIALLKNDGTVEAISCNYNGNYYDNGAVLYMHYSNVEKIKSLLLLGDLSSLGKDLGNSSEQWTENCVSYKRDYGEDRRDFSKYQDLAHFLLVGSSENSYIFKEKNNNWYVLNTKTDKLVRLDKLLMKDIQVSALCKNLITNNKVKENYNKLNKKLSIKEIEEQPKKLKI